jgi:hypothetical protein
MVRIYRGNLRISLKSNSNDRGINRFCALNTRILIVGSLLVGLAGIVWLWPEDEAQRPVERIAAPDSSPDYRSRQPSPKQAQPGGRYGRAVSPRAWENKPDYGPAAPRYYGYPAGNAAPYGQVAPEPDPMERFTFRPLSERERKRSEAERPETYYGGPAAPSSQPYTEWYDQQPEPNRYYPAPAYPNRQGNGYSYRPYQPGTEARDQWADPYRDWSEGQDYQNPAATPAPRWGSQPRGSAPPSRSMYPSLDGYKDRRFTAR